MLACLMGLEWNEVDDLVLIWTAIDNSYMLVLLHSFSKRVHDNHHFDGM